MLRVAQNDTARLRNLNEASCLTTLGTIVAMLLVGATTNAQQLVRVGYSGTGVAKNLHKTIERSGLWKKAASIFGSKQSSTQSLVADERKSPSRIDEHLFSARAMLIRAEESKDWPLVHALNASVF